MLSPLILRILKLFLLGDVALGKKGGKMVSFEWCKEGLAKFKRSFWFMDSCCVTLKELLRLMSFFKKKAILEDHCASLALANKLIYEVRW